MLAIKIIQEIKQSMKLKKLHSDTLKIQEDFLSTNFLIIVLSKTLSTNV